MFWHPFYPASDGKGHEVSVNEWRDLDADYWSYNFHEWLSRHPGEVKYLGLSEQLSPLFILLVEYSMILTQFI